MQSESTLLFDVSNERGGLREVRWFRRPVETLVR
jgi:hypothetical protein